MEFDTIAVDRSAVSSKLGLNQHTFKISARLELIRFENNGASSTGIFPNLSDSGIKARHRIDNGQRYRVNSWYCRSRWSSRPDVWIQHKGWRKP
jgi:hypothetical protein